jgi:hypothetical protein
MDTTDKIVQQVQSLACGKNMSAKNLRYSHAKYCTERSQELQPVEIPVPQIEIKSAPELKDRKSLPVKRSKAKPQEEEEEAPTYDADEVPPQPPPQPSRQPPEKRETPEQFWNNTIQNMREKKLTQ